MSRYTCPECARAILAQDRFCPACGTRVAAVALLRAEIPVGEQCGDPVVRLHNTGHVPVTAWLPQNPLESSPAPAWLVLPPRGAGEAHRIEPGEVLQLALEVRPRAFGRGTDGRPPVTACELRVVTDADLVDQVRRVRLTLEGHAALTPPVVDFPCIPASGLAEPIPLPFAVYNGGGRPLRVDRIEIRPATPADAPIAALVDVPAFLEPVEVAPGDTRPLGLRLLPPKGDSPQAVRRARLHVVCHHPAGIPPSEGQLLLALARPPRLEVVSAPGVQQVGGPEAYGATLRNTGALPFEVTGLTCPAPWVELDPLARRVLTGGETLEVKWTIHPDRRTGEELRATRLRTTIDVETAPRLPAPAQIPVQVEVEEVERLEHAVLGVDFGTSNSAVALLDTDGEVASLQIEVDPTPAAEMPSLMFFHHPEGARTAFVYGSAARNRASTDPGNLVRSLKRVLSDAPQREWLFAWSEGEERQFETWRTPELARELIRELVRRSVEAYGRLPGRRARGRVRFTRAVFTHPVKVTDALANTLWEAARAAGLDGGAQSMEEFRRTSMLDEASAAIIHYLAWREGTGLPRREDGEERVLCFDVGGGTTDVTAVHSREPEPDVVEVAILHTSGDDRFGGEDLDRAVARLLLTAARAQDPELRADLVLDALDVREPLALRARLTGIPPEAADLVAERAYRASIHVIEQAERAKITLGGAPETRVLLPADLPRGPHAAAGRAPIQVDLQKADVDALVAAGASRVLYLLDQAVQGARWTWDDVDTLLFTGQTCRSDVLRGVVLRHVAERRGTRPLRVVDPVGSDGTPPFDPKACVAAGAARFGAWGGGLRVVMAQTLAYPIAYRNPVGRFIPIPGLEVGATLPARGRLVARQSPYRLLVYATDRLLGSVTVRDIPPGTEVDVVAEREDLLWLEWGEGNRVPFSREGTA